MKAYCTSRSSILGETDPVRRDQFVLALELPPVIELVNIFVLFVLFVLIKQALRVTIGDQAIKQCQRDAVRLPDDCSIVGCDDIEFAQYVTPELTTIAVPARELGARAARLLVQLIEQSAQRVSSRRPLPVRLMTRASSGPAPTRPTLPLPI